MMVGRRLSYWDGLFSGAMLNFQGVSVLFQSSRCLWALWHALRICNFHPWAMKQIVALCLGREWTYTIGSFKRNQQLILLKLPFQESLHVFINMYTYMQIWTYKYCVYEQYQLVELRIQLKWAYWNFRTHYHTWSQYVDISNMERTFASHALRKRNKRPVDNVLCEAKLRNYETILLQE